MKGIIFREFVDTVDEAFGEATTDAMFDRCPHATGAYTTVGTYEASELFALVGALSEETNVSADDLQRVYAHRLMKRFAVLHPDLFEGVDHVFDFLESVESVIHVEVRKLYPEADLPSFETLRRDEHTLILRYRSSSNMWLFCKGMIEGSLAHFEAIGEIEPSHGTDESGRYTDFRIMLAPAEHG